MRPPAVPPSFRSNCASACAPVTPMLPAHERSKCRKPVCNAWQEGDNAKIVFVVAVVVGGGASLGVLRESILLPSQVVYHPISPHHNST